MKRLIMVLVLVCFVLSSSVNLYAKDLNIAFADKLKIVFEYNKAKKLNEELEKENEKAKKNST